MLYNTYYDELETFAKMQSNSPLTNHPHAGYYHNHNQMPHLTDDDDDEPDELYDIEDENYKSESDDSGVHEFATSLTVQG